MEQFIDHMIFACFSAAGIGIAIAAVAGIIYGINALTNNKLQDKILSFFESEPEFEDE